MKVNIESNGRTDGFPLTWDQIKDQPGFYACDYGKRIVQIVNTNYLEAKEPFILWNNADLQNYGHNAARCPSVTAAKFRRIVGTITLEMP